MNKKYKIIFAIFIGCVFLMLYTHICILIGVMREREGRICVGAPEFNSYQKTLNVAELICAENYEYKKKELQRYQDEVKEWKDAYLYLKSKQEKTAEQVVQSVL